MIEKRLLKIDSTTVNNHYYLDTQDLCYYFGDYYARQGFGHSPMNQLIFNLKKPMDKKDTSSWQYKETAIKTIADAIIGLKQWEKLKQYTWIPIPSSKVREDPAYDDRLMKILTTINKGADSSLDIRDILT
ncbi:MAG: hypothetical protein PSV35_08200, partial [bacterium]|nr:hypothetical protein [bacterium]